VVIAVHLSGVHLASLYRSPARLSLKSKALVSATRYFGVVSMYLSRGFRNDGGLDSQFALCVFEIVTGQQFQLVPIL